MTSKIRLGMVMRAAEDEKLAFAAQLGMDTIVLAAPSLNGKGAYGAERSNRSAFDAPGEPQPVTQWDAMELLQLRKHVESFGLTLEIIQNVPLHWLENSLLGLPGRDGEIERYQNTLRALGAAGVGTISYNWMPGRVWRTSMSETGRGGATVNSYDHQLAARMPLSHGRSFSQDDLREAYTYFIRAVLPVAEEAGVTLALHPDDPPVQELGGVSRLFNSLEAHKWALEELAPSPNHKLTFCMGSWAEMGVDTMLAGMRYFGERGKLSYLHFRNVRGAVPAFRETFHDEGDVDMAGAMNLLLDVGFDGVLVDDHVPEMPGDSHWKHRGHAFACGYIRGLLQAAEHGRR